MDYDKIMASAPVNAQAARQMGRGVDWKPAATILNAFDDVPAVRSVTRQEEMNPEFRDLTGLAFGRVKVIGLLSDSGSRNRGRWVARCVCGRFCQFRTKTLLGPHGARACCGACEYVRKIRDGWIGWRE